jgi:peptidoglycan/LPS O-acetylase OafA/YrhL
MIEWLFFNAVTVALSALVLPAVLFCLLHVRLSSGRLAAVLIVNALVVALLWVTLRSQFLHGEQWSYSGPLYIHWGIVLGSLAAWQWFSRRSPRAAGNQPLQ